MDNEKIFELMTKMYAEMQEGFNKVNKKIDGLENEVSNLKSETSVIKNTVLKIENEHGKKLEALFDGYKQNSEQLSDIKNEVAKHEEVIIRRVK